jgi:signal transduction histidine kinase
MFSISYLLISLLAVGLIIGIASLMILDTLVLSRIIHLNADVNTVGASGKLSGRVRMEGRDELAGIAGSINRMLEAQEHAQSERKLIEEIRSENERLNYALKNKAEFLATMSHELRTPLNAIIGFSEILKQKGQGQLKEKYQRYAENVYESGKQLQNLVNNVLEISQAEAGKIELNIEKICVPDILEEILLPVREKTAKDTIIFKKELDPSLGYVDADKLRFKHILLNLLNNALKFSKPEGGTVTITTKKQGDMALFSISDTGTGIKEEDMDRMFREFGNLYSSVPEGRKGTGIGLEIAKKLVELHGGELTMQSRYGEGTTLTFSLPDRGKEPGKEPNEETI